MKKMILMLTAAVMSLSLTACGSKDVAAMQDEIAALRERVAVLEMQVSELKQAPAVTVPAGTEEQVPALSEEHQLIADAVKAVLDSDIIAQCWKDYADMAGSAPRDVDIASIVRYQTGDFEGEKMDCWLVNIHSDIGMADKHTILNSFQVFVEAETGEHYDSISVDAMGYAGSSLATLQEKATYLLWSYGNMVNHPDETGSLLNSSEIITELPAGDVDAINNYLK